MIDDKKYWEPGDIIRIADDTYAEVVSLEEYDKFVAMKYKKGVRKEIERGKLVCYWISRPDSEKNYHVEPISEIKKRLFILVNPEEELELVRTLQREELENLEVVHHSLSKHMQNISFLERMAIKIAKKR